MTHGRSLAGLLTDRCGAAAIMVAVAFMVLAGATALATDASLLQWQRRRLQAAVDAAALSAVRAPMERQTLRATEAVTANGFPAASVAALAGTYTPDPTRTVAGRFVAGGGSLSAAPALQVDAEINAPVTLMRLFGGDATARVAARAIAAHQPMAAFAVGSGLASVGNGLVNGLLGGLLGGSLSLSAADYNALLSTEVAALTFLNVVATAVNLTAGSYDALLESTAGVGLILQAAANALSPDTPDATARNALLNIAAAVGNNRTLRLGDLLALGANGTRPVGSLGDDLSYATLGLNAYDLLAATAVLGGRNSVVDIGTGINLPGVASVGVKVMVIEPPATSGLVAADGQIALGPVGTQAHTMQVRVMLDIQLLSITQLLGIPAVVRVPIIIEGAGATATLSSVTCGAEPETDVAMRIDVTTGIARVAVGQVSAPAFAAAGTPLNPQPATIVDLGLMRLHAAGTVNIGSGSGVADFNAQQIAAREVVRVNTTAQGGSILGRLVGNITLTPEIIGLGLPLGNLLSQVTTPLNAALGLLDPLVIGLLNVLGINLGYADIRPAAARCGVVALVQ